MATLTQKQMDDFLDGKWDMELDVSNPPSSPRNQPLSNEIIFTADVKRAFKDEYASLRDLRHNERYRDLVEEIFQATDYNLFPNHPRPRVSSSNENSPPPLQYIDHSNESSRESIHLSGNDEVRQDEDFLACYEYLLDKERPLLPWGRILPSINTDLNDEVMKRLSMLSLFADENPSGKLATWAFTNLKKIEGTCFMYFCQDLDDIPNPHTLTTIFNYGAHRLFTEKEIDPLTGRPKQGVLPTYQTFINEMKEVEEYVQAVSNVAPLQRPSVGHFSPLARLVGESIISGTQRAWLLYSHLTSCFNSTVRFTPDEIEERIAPWFKEKIDTAITKTYKNFLYAVGKIYQGLEERSDMLSAVRAYNEERNRIIAGPTANFSYDQMHLASFIQTEKFRVQGSNPTPRFPVFLGKASYMGPIFRGLLLSSQQPERSDMFDIIYRAYKLTIYEKRQFYDHFRVYQYLFESSYNSYPDWVNPYKLHIAVRIRSFFTDLANFFLNANFAYAQQGDVTADQLCDLTNLQISTGLPARVVNPTQTEFDSYVI